MEAKQTDYTIAEGYSLPSKGLIYSKPVNPRIELRSMTTREEMKRMAPSNLPYKNLSEIIETCMLTKPAISVYDMCIGDYEYLLHKLRVVSYGPEYNMTVICPNCGNIINSKIDLDELEVIDFDEADFNESLKVHLDKSNREIVLNFQTPRLLDEIATRTAELKKKSKDAGVDFSLLATLEKMIDTVDGQKLDYTAKQIFIEALPVKDVNKIKHSIDITNKKVGLKTDNIQVKCPTCEYEVNTFFRFGPEFFRPTED